ncbi:MAG: hypothetical protein ABIS45_02505 [Burkholderiales bacterium]
MLNNSQAAMAGSKALVAYFIAAAGQASRYFVAGPVWNSFDRLTDEKIQFLRYSFRDAEPDEICFSTEQLAGYGSGDQSVARVVEAKILASLT